MNNSQYDNMGEQEISNAETGLSLELQDWKNLDKASIKDKVDAVVQSIQDGWVDPVDGLIFAKKGIEMFTTLEKNVRHLAEEKGVGKLGVEKYNVKVSESMTGVSYDYAGCGDVVWNNLNDETAKLKEKLKQREKLLQGVTKKTIMGDPDTAEAWEVMPPIKSGKLGLKIEMK